MEGTMVVCLSCKNVVWAYDANMGDVRGILNMMKIHCRLCGAKGNFDGWRINGEVVEYVECFDAWSAMHKIAEQNGFSWNPSGDNVW